MRILVTRGSTAWSILQIRLQTYIVNTRGVHDHRWGMNVDQVTVSNAAKGRERREEQAIIINQIRAAKYARISRI